MFQEHLPLVCQLTSTFIVCLGFIYKPLNLDMKPHLPSTSKIVCLFQYIPKQINKTSSTERTSSLAGFYCEIMEFQLNLLLQPHPISLKPTWKVMVSVDQVPDHYAQTNAFVGHKQSDSSLICQFLLTKVSSDCNKENSREHLQMDASLIHYDIDSKSVPGLAPSGSFPLSRSITSFLIFCK